MSGVVTVIGIGEDGLAGLSQAARDILDTATVIAGAKRHLSMLPEDDTRERRPWSKDLVGDISKLGAAATSETVCVLASGEPLCHGIAIRMIDVLGADAVRVMPHPGAFSLAAARMGWALSDPLLRTVSVHAQPFGALRRSIQPGIKLMILSRNGSSPADIAEALKDMGYGRSPMTVLERIGGDKETRTDSIADDGFEREFDNLNTVAITCVADDGVTALSRAPGLPDDAFDHDGTITKRDVRAVTLAALAPKPGEVLWDVGAGNGTIAIEWLRAEPAARAVAIERDPERLKRIRINAENLGVPELEIVEGVFPDAPSEITNAPDAIFIGGGISEDADVIATAFDALKPGGRLVANAVSIEAQGHLMTALRVLGGELVRIGIAQAAPVGRLTAMKSAIDVLQWRVTKS